MTSSEFDPSDAETGSGTSGPGSAVPTPIVAWRKPRPPSDPGGLTAPAAAVALASAADEPQVARLVLSALRGRYVLVTVLGLLAAGVAAGVASRFVKPKYESDVLVRVRYSLPEVMQESDVNRPIPMYDTFMQSQKLVITSRAVLDLAIVDPVWKAMGRAVPLEPDRYFAKNLKVDIRPRSEYILIAVEDEDPVAAAAAVNAISNAYADHYKSEEERLGKERLGLLSENERTLLQQVQDATKQLDEAGKAFGTAKLDMIYDAAAERWKKADAALSEIRVAIAAASSRPEDAVNNKGDAGRDEQLSPEQLAVLDPQMRAYVDERDRAAAHLKLLRAQGSLEAQPQLRLAKATYDDACERVEHYASVVRTVRPAGGGVAGDGNRAGSGLLGQSVGHLKQTEANIVTVRDEALADMRKYGDMRSRADKLAAALNDKRAELERVQIRLNSIRNESSLGGRLSVVSTGEIPLSPVRDSRRTVVPAAAAAGLCFPAALVVAGSIVSRRKIRFAEEAQGQGPARGRLLGILPSLDGPPDGETMAGAAHSVHQIRVTLRAQANHEGPNVYLLTSSAAGDGKTSLAMSLGFSFAASRARTLVIDCDLVGRHLSRNLRALDVEGFNEALENPRLQGLVRRVSPNLCVMSAGRASSGDACGISATKVRAVLAEARRHFDVILIDSGPILGSVEAAVLAQEVDGVLFTISRGQEREVVERSVERVDGLGARIEGFVFNRAETRDFLRSSFSSSSQTSKPSSGETVGGRLFGEDAGTSTLASRLSAFGPLVRAMVASVPPEMLEGDARQP